MENLILDLSIILVGSAVLSYLAVLMKQPIVITYILCGVLVGPWGLGLIHNLTFIEGVSHLGITLLLFLAGLCLHPQKLIGLFKKTSLVTLLNCFFSFVLSFLFAGAFGFPLKESLFIGLALMFSSTILVIKLLPTLKLHHQRMGALCISVLIIQDLLAVGVLAFVRSMDVLNDPSKGFLMLFVKLCIFLAILVLFERYILRKIMARVERTHEVLFVLGLAWCFGVASISNKMGLFYETGAFFAGVVLARHKISFYISERLKPIRDFFLVLFFFALGAKLDFVVLKSILLPSLLLSGLLIIFKPWGFKTAFVIAGETKEFSQEIGMRLGQLSEFSLLVSFLAFELGDIGSQAAQLIQLTTILTFIISSYIVVYNYPTPIGTSEDLIRD